MKAVRMTAIGQPLALQEIPMPSVGPGDVLVRIKAAGICHSDAHYRAGVSSTGPLPQTLGHEIAGVVAAVGPQVTRIRPGDRVCLHYLVTCGQCEHCNRGQRAILRRRRRCWASTATAAMPNTSPSRNGAWYTCRLKSRSSTPRS